MKHYPTRQEALEKRFADDDRFQRQLERLDRRIDDAFNHEVGTSGLPCWFWGGTVALMGFVAMLALLT